METLKEKSKFIREVLGLTQKQFAVMIGTNQTKISLIENGLPPPNKEGTRVIKAIETLYKQEQSNG